MFLKSMNSREKRDFIIYHGSGADLALFACSKGKAHNQGPSFEFSINEPPEMDYYIRFYGIPGTSGQFCVNWEPIMQRNECFNPVEAGCNDLFDIDHPIPGLSTDQIPCMSESSYPVSGQWLELFVPGKTAAIVSMQPRIEVTCEDLEYGQSCITTKKRAPAFDK